MSYQEVAKIIVRESIRSAICLDDMFEQPYMTKDDIEQRNGELSKREKKPIALNRELPRKLYNSFRVLGECDLEVYNFKSIAESWHPMHMLNNKDLMVLDWELEGKGNYQSSIQILRDAISTNDYHSIPFIIIYTYRPKEDFVPILEELLENFNPFPEKEKEVIFDTLFNSVIEAFEGCFDTEIDRDTFIEAFEGIRIKLMEYWKNTNGHIRDQIFSEICSVLNDELQILDSKKPKTNTKLKKALKQTFDATPEKCIELLFYLMCDSTNDDDYSVSRIDSTNFGFKINNSLLTLFSKDEDGSEGVKPEEVFETFSDLVCNDPNNFLTLLSIEMKNKLKDDFCKIGKKISSFDERAFFHHLNSYKERSENYKNEFFDFLLANWTSEIEAYNLNQTPLVFSEIDSYIDARKLHTIDKNGIKQQLADLVVSLSTTNPLKRLEKDPQIRFGDIFRAEREVENSTYFLSLTPKCVCVDAFNKVQNNYFFIKSENVSEDLKSALEKMQTEYYSIIRDNDKNLSIKWGECKLFTSWIKDNDFSKLKTKFADIEYNLVYVTTLKETYAQRIANKAFGYGLSIGIDLPHL